jgi:hypothetical protein
MAATLSAALRNNAPASRLHLLELTLERQGVMPRRNFSSPAEFEAYLKEDKDIILDGSEQPMQRPAAEQAQKDAYSGKKNTIPLRRPGYKELIISRPSRQIIYISQSYPGHEHDYKLLQTEFPPDLAWFATCRVRLDRSGDPVRFSRLCR